MAPRRQPAEPADPSPLGEPLHLPYSNTTAPNRFLKAAMTERLSSWDPTNLQARGIPSSELINVYRRWGEGGSGLILTGNTMVDYQNLEAAGNPIIPRDATFEGERFDRFKALAAAAKKNGSLVHAQLSHAGRQVADHIQPNPVSASDVQLEGIVVGQTYAKPKPMDARDIEEVVGNFAHAAEFSYKAGFDGVQLHAAHGYLLAQFLSKTTNKRTDEYGGSVLNRSRIIFEISDAIRARVPDPSFSVGIKVNSVEFQADGFTPEDCAALVQEVERRGFDYVELSGGTYQSLAFAHKRESSRRRESFFLEFAETIIPRLDRTKAYVTGGLRSTKAMVDALGTVHGVGLARPVAQEFDLPRKLIAGEVYSAIDTLLDEQDFGITNVAAGTQIRLVGRDKQPLDLSREDHKKVFESSVQQWGEMMANNSDKSKFGYVDINGIKLEPFGSAYSAA